MSDSTKVKRQHTPDDVLPQRVKLGALAIVYGVLAIVTAAFSLNFNPPVNLFMLLGFAAFLVAGYIALDKYYQLTFSWHTATARPSGKPDLKIETKEVKEIAESIFPNLITANVVAFYDLLVNPAEMIERITESVEPLTRSTLVRTTQSIVFSTSMAKTTVVIPVHWQAKDQLGAGMRFYGEDDRRLSSLSQKFTLAYAAAAIRFLVLSVNQGALDDYVRYLEDDVVSGLAGFPGSEAVTRLSSASFTKQLYALNKGNSRDAFFVFSMIERVIEQFLENRIVCLQASVPALGSPASPFASQLRLTSEVRLPPRLRLGPPSGDPAARLRRLATEARRWIGVRPSSVYFSITNASRASSYHVQIAGPQGTYLGRQHLLDAASDAPLSEEIGNYAMSPRRGQRHSHLYVHGGHGLREAVFVNHFFERMPGSMGAATMSSVAATLLIWLCSAVSLNREQLTRAAPIGGTDLVAILLAFPVVIALWVGVDRQQALVGDVMLAKLTKLLTVTLCILAAFLYVLSSPTSETQGAAWVWIGGLAMLNTVACCTSWYLRARVHDHFIRLSEES